MLVEHVARMERTRDVYKILSRIPEEKKPIGKLKCGLEGNTKVDLK